MPGEGQHDGATRILILADDLSGAADCGVACTEAGLATQVLLDADAARRDAAPALAVDLDSRGLRSAEAADRVRRAAARLLGPASLLYKKIDSTLRGQPGAEIAAARDAVAATLPSPALVIVAPAFPATGRTLRGGRVLVHGVPLERTQTWRREGGGADPDLAAMLHAAGLNTRTLPLPAIRSAALAEALRRAAADRVGAVLCDAETEADLAAIAASGAMLGPAVVWAGSGGLARPLAALVAAGGGVRPAAPRASRRRGAVAVVLGSLSAVTQTQAAALAAQPGSRMVALCDDDAVPRLAAAFAAAGDGGVVVVSIGAGPTAQEQPVRALSAALARLVAPQAGRIGALVASGGETARAVLGAMGVAGLRLIGEIEPGVPLGMTGTLPVVTKAGAFGERDTLIRCAEALRALPVAAAAYQEDEGCTTRGR